MRNTAAGGERDTGDSMDAVILSVGDELILGQTVDTNSAWLSSQLILRGCMPSYHKTVGDDADGIASAIREATGVANLVIITGGLGPTEDDMTRQALAKMLKKPLRIDDESLAAIEAFFRSIGRPMPVANRAQAMHPEGTKVLQNLWGTAPGIHALIGNAHVFAFPGVPPEMKAMYERYIVPHLEQSAGRFIHTESVTTYGAGESNVAHILGDLMSRLRNPLVGTTVSAGEVTIRVRSDFDTEDQALRECERTVDEIKERLGAWLIGTGGVSLAEATIRLARQRGMRLVVAESCTGGLLAKLLTDIPGASEMFLGGWVTYSNDLKTKELGVDPAVIQREGAVSEAVAIAMAEGALKASGADVALSLTGIAGPGGGTATKPVGTVWMAMAFREGDRIVCESEHCLFPGSRDMIRLRAAKTAINRLRLALVGRRI
jgi:nicotinamide-nucleotide amidase